MVDTNNKFVLLCDESGAKGFNDKPDTSGEPIGVVSCAILQETEYNNIVSEVSSLRDKYKLEGKKFHITDLTPENQELLRLEVYSIVKRSKAKVAFQAITQDGAHEWYKFEKKYFDKIKAEKKEEGFGYTFSDYKKRIQTILFVGAIDKSLAYICENEEHPYNFSMLLHTDNIDDKTKDEIKSEVESFLRFELKSSKEICAKRFNYKNKTVEEKAGTIGFTINVPEVFDIGDLSNVAFDITIDTETDIVADVLSNSILHYLKQSFKDNKSINLNSAQAIIKHPLNEEFVSLATEDGYDLLNALYGFPLASTEQDDLTLETLESLAKDITFKEK